MSFLSRIGDFIIDIGGTIINGIRAIFGVKPKSKPIPTEKIRAALRKQWLEVGADQQIPGVEYEGVVYYDTPH